MSEQPSVPSPLDQTDDDVHAPHGLLPTGGTVRPITRWGTPVMHRPQQPVTAYDAELATLVADMVATMYAADGVGLAACQIGVDRAVFVFDCPDESGRRTVGVVCNPELAASRRARTAASTTTTRAACPSPAPSWAAPDRTPPRCAAPGSTAGPVTFTGDGLLARALQHETDHTRGTVFGDRIPTKARKKLQKAHDKAADDYPDGWPA